MNSYYYKFLLIIFIFQNNFTVNYDHEMFVLSADIKKSFPVSDSIKNIAYNANNFLNYSKFFNTELIVNTSAVKNEFNKDLSHKEISIETEDGETLTCSFFDRQSDNIIIVGPGFTNCKEKMAPFVHMFGTYDVLLINFRGHGYKTNFTLNPFYHTFELGSNIKLGTKEELDTFAAINFARKNKNYKNVIGLGICFGAFVFAKSQGIAEENNLPRFDKLILDGCWPSLNEFIEKIKADPYLMLNPQTGGASDEVKWIFKRNIVPNTIVGCIESLCEISIKGVDIRSYIKKIKQTPVLYFYGKDDLTISRNQFENIWNNIGSSNKLGIITSNPHVHNHLKSKELYKLISDIFIEQNTEQAQTLLSDSQKLTEFLNKKFKDQLTFPVINFPKHKKLIKAKTIINNLNDYKFTALVFGGLYAGYKYGKIQQTILSKITTAYICYKLFVFGWRPTVKLLSKFIQ